jgi:tRNA A-37 threonylcarbamoyl transferase component Bud32
MPLQRFSKVYRHPTLDVRITLERLTTEARCMLRARRACVDAPVLYLVDHSAFWGPIGSRLKKDFRLINDEAMQSLTRQVAAASVSQPDATGSGSPMAVDLDTSAGGADSSRPTGARTAPAGAAGADGGAAAAATALTAAVATAVASLPPAGGPRIVMERVHGVTVKAFLDSPLVRPSDRARLAQDIGLAIARLHDGGIIHGDLTTSNVMVRGLPHPRGVDVLTAAPPADGDAASEADTAASGSSGAAGLEALAASSLAAPSLAHTAEPLSTLGFAAAVAAAASAGEPLAAATSAAGTAARGGAPAGVTEVAPEGSATAAAARSTSSATSTAGLAGAAAGSGSSVAPPNSTPIPISVSLHLHFPVVIIDYGLASMSAAVR